MPASTSRSINTGSAAFPPFPSLDRHDAPAVDAVTGAHYFQVMHLTDGSTAVRAAAAGPWKAIRGAAGRFNPRGSQAAAFAADQNRAPGRAS